MVNILGLSGSLREGSFNSALLRAAAELAPPLATLQVGTIRGIPLYDGDVEDTEGIPETVSRLKEQIAAADGLLLVTPEYNSGIPGVFKNAIDWASRPPGDIGRIFGNRPVALIGASSGRFGTILSQDAWLTVLHKLGMQPWSGGRLMVSNAQTLLDDQNRLTDEATRKRLAKFLRGFAEFVAQHRRTPREE